MRREFINVNHQFVEQNLRAEDRPRKVFHFYVSGNGPFPIDMLRHDRAWPSHESDSAKVLQTVGSSFGEVRTVEMRSLDEPTIGRWASFGWIVTAHEAVPDAK